MPKTDELPEFIAEEIRRRYPRDQWSYQRIADDLGVSKPQVHDLLTRGKGVGPTFETAFAAKFFAGSVDRLRRESQKWMLERNRRVHARAEDAPLQSRINDSVPAIATVRERYSAMPAVRAMAHAEGYPAEFVESFEALLELPEQPTADALWTLCKGAYVMWRGKSAKSKTTPGDDLDERPRNRRR